MPFPQSGLQKNTPSPKKTTSSALSATRPWTATILRSFKRLTPSLAQPAQDAQLRHPNLRSRTQRDRAQMTARPARGPCPDGAKIHQPRASSLASAALGNSNPAQPHSGWECWWPYEPDNQQAEPVTLPCPC